MSFSKIEDNSIVKTGIQIKKDGGGDKLGVGYVYSICGKQKTIK